MTGHNTLEGLFAKSFEKPSDLLCCAFGLLHSEIDTYFALVSGEKRAEEIAALVRMDRTTIQRALKRLLERQLVVRDRRDIERGGYYYVYRAVSPEDVRREILSQLDHWYDETRRFLLGKWPEPQR